MRQPVPFGKYLLLDRISVGGMAEVFRAKSYGVEGFEKIIAIKRILPSMGEDRDFIKMFIDEAKIAGQLSHANICQIFELGRIQGSHFIAMEYIWGKDLLQIQNRFRKLKQMMPVSLACHVAAKVAEGLDHAHRKRDAMGRPLEIVHRDCSPQNVLVSYEGEVKIIDFGIARAASRSSRTNAGVLKGKFGYMSPEQVRGLPLDHRSDIFALGTVLYECLVGDRLFQGESDFSTLEKVRNVDIRPPRHYNDSIPAEVEGIVMKALARDPKQRYQHCAELHTDLMAFLTRQQAVFTAKGLGDWLKQGFREELLREKHQMEEYKRVGRDGLIAGVPQAAARLDVVEHLGVAPALEGDPTTLGGPSFDDQASDPAVAAPVVQRPTGKREDGEFEEGPTEIFGEIGFGGGDDMRVVAQGVAAAAPVAAPVAAWPAAAAPAAWPTPAPGSAFAQASAPAGYAQEGARGPAVAYPRQSSPPSSSLQLGHEPPAYYPAGTPGASAPMLGGPVGGAYATPWPGPAGGTAPAYAPYPVTSESFRTVTPPVVAPRRPRRTRRSSLGKDVAIGIAIAALVLALFVTAKYVFFSSTSRAHESPIGAGTIAVQASDGKPAEVALNGRPAGAIEGGRPLVLSSLEPGDYAVVVSRAGAKPCGRDVHLEAKKVEVVSCDVTPTAAWGRLILRGLEAGDTVLVDDQEIADESTREPIQLSVDTAHTVSIRRGDATAEEFQITVKPGEEQEHVVVGHGPNHDEAGIKAPTGSGHDGHPTLGHEPTGVVVHGHDDGGHDKAVVRPGDDKTHGKTDPTGGPSHGRTGDAASNDAGGSAVGSFTAFTRPFARVFIDGKDTGKMTPIAPRQAISLAPGPHNVTFVVGDQRFPFSITIQAGHSQKLVKDLPVAP